MIDSHTTGSGRWHSRLTLLFVCLALGLGMPKLNGLDVAARVQKQEHPPRVVILSMHADESYIMRALAAGARAYLLKDATDEDLVPALRAVAAGKPFSSPAVAGVLVEDYVRQLQARGLTDSYHLLTDREREVLQLLAEGRSNKEVATLLDLGLSTIEAQPGDAALVAELRRLGETAQSIHADQPLSEQHANVLRFFSDAASVAHHLAQARVPRQPTEQRGADRAASVGELPRPVNTHAQNPGGVR